MPEKNTVRCGFSQEYKKSFIVLVHRLSFARSPSLSLALLCECVCVLVSAWNVQYIFVGTIYFVFMEYIGFYT